MSTPCLTNGQLANKEELKTLVQTVFPPVVHAFGYGSGVFSQQQDLQHPLSTEQMHANHQPSQLVHQQSPKMIDLILVVEDAVEFHTEMLKRHPNHYSLPCKLGGPLFCAHIQNGYGAKLFYHAFIPVQDKLLKYGVIEKRYMLNDLKDWTYLYAAGRLHKPTLSLISDDELVHTQQYYNLPFALATSLLLLDETATASLAPTIATAGNQAIPSFQLHKSNNNSQIQKASLSTVFQSIAQISYSGDPRMDVGGEDPNKIPKLVFGNDGQWERFRALYQPALNKLSQGGFLSLTQTTNKRSNNLTTEIPTMGATVATPDDEVEWDPSFLRQHVSLPPPLRQYWSPSLSSGHSKKLYPTICSIVRNAARTQSFKGILTAGIARSTQYALAKLSKGLLRPA